MVKIKRGDTFNDTLEVKNQDGTYVDCTGWTIKIAVKDYIPETSETDDTGAVITKEITGSSTGKHSYTFTATETDIDPKSYQMEFEVTKDDGSIHSSETESFVIEADIVRG